MRGLRRILCVAVAGVCCLAWSGWAQGQGPGDGQGPEDKPGPNWGQIQAYVQWLKNDKGVRPERPLDLTKVPEELREELQEAIEEAKTARAAFVEAQKKLLEQWKEATTAEARQELRDQMRQALEKFREDQKANIQDIKETLKQIREQFADKRNELIDQARERARDQKGNRGE